MERAILCPRCTGDTPILEASLLIGHRGRNLKHKEVMLMTPVTQLANHSFRAQDHFHLNPQLLLFLLVPVAFERGQDKLAVGMLLRQNWEGRKFSERVVRLRGWHQRSWEWRGSGREQDGPQGQNLQEGQMVRTQLLSDRSPWGPERPSALFNTSGLSFPAVSNTYCTRISMPLFQKCF